MNVKGFEWRAIEFLVKDVLPSAVFSALKAEAELVKCEYSGCGYFLTLRHPQLPLERIVCDRPLVVGTWEGIDCGFLVFLENRELMLECHSFGAREVPPSYREQEVRVHTA